METTKQYLQRGLWDDDQLAPISEEKAVELLGPHFPVLATLLMGAFEDLRRYRASEADFREFDEEQCAILLTMLVTNRARDALKDCPKIKVRRTRYRKVAIVIDERLELTVKKLSPSRGRACRADRLRRSNYQTRRNKRHWDQRKGVADASDLPRLILGYRFQKELTELRLIIAYPRSQKTMEVEWAYTIPPQSSASPVTGPQLAALPPADDDEDKGFTISAADTTERAAGGERNDGT